MVSLMDLVNTIGRMVVILKESLKMVLEMVKVYGKKELEIVINMRENMRMIKNQVMEYLHGVQVMFIKVIMKVM